MIQQASNLKELEEILDTEELKKNKGIQDLKWVLFSSDMSIKVKSYEFLTKLLREKSEAYFPEGGFAEAIKKHLKPTTKRRYNFNDVKSILNGLSTNKSKIEYLIEMETEYLQEYGSTDPAFLEGNSFVQKCELERQKIEKIEALTAVSSGNGKEGNKSSLANGNQQDDQQISQQVQLIGFSNAQIVLIFYYFLKSCGIEPRVNVDIAPIAKFLHLITGKDLSTVANSDFYKKLQQVPNFKTDKELIKDLEAIKPMFQTVQLMEVVRMIDNEIDMSRSQMKLKKEVY